MLIQLYHFQANLIWCDGTFNVYIKIHRQDVLSNNIYVIQTCHLLRKKVHYNTVILLSAMSFYNVTILRVVIF
jgi:hypothetical protein